MVLALVLKGDMDVQDLQLVPEQALSGLGEVLPVAPKELEQDDFLHIVVLVDGDQVAYLGVVPAWHGPVHPCHGHPVAGLHAVHKATVHIQHHVERSLAGEHVVRGLLLLHHLLVGEVEALVGLAFGKEGGLRDPVMLNINVGRVPADGVLEVGQSCLGDQVGGADDHAGDQLVDILWVQLPRVCSLISAERTDLGLVAELAVWVLQEEDLIDGQVKGGDGLLGLADDLPVQVLVEPLDVAAVDWQEGLLRLGNLLQPLQVVRCSGVLVHKSLVIGSVGVGKHLDKLGHLGLALVDTVVRAPDSDVLVVLGVAELGLVKFAVKKLDVVAVVVDVLLVATHVAT